MPAVKKLEAACTVHDWEEVKPVQLSFCLAGLLRVLVPCVGHQDNNHCLDLALSIPQHIGVGCTAKDLQAPAVIGITGSVGRNSAGTPGSNNSYSIAAS